jgi:Uncharacterized conserved protein
MKEVDVFDDSSINIIRLYTIGFAGKGAQVFFEKLKSHNINRVIDVRLNNVSQLAGFAKKNDLQYFLKEICNIDYIHDQHLAPTKDILDGYKKKNGISWDEYERLFNGILLQRRPDTKYSLNDLNNACLLCSENTAKNCHRRLVAEFFREKWNNILIEHL